MIGKSRGSGFQGLETRGGHGRGACTATEVFCCGRGFPAPRTQPKHHAPVEEGAPLQRTTFHLQLSLLNSCSSSARFLFRLVGVRCVGCVCWCRWGARGWKAPPTKEAALFSWRALRLGGVRSCFPPFLMHPSLRKIRVICVICGCFLFWFRRGARGWKPRPQRDGRARLRGCSRPRSAERSYAVAGVCCEDQKHGHNIIAPHRVRWMILYP